MYKNRTPYRTFGEKAFTIRHLLWIPAGAVIGFLTSLVFGDLLFLPLDLYYLIYFTIMIGFFAFYTVKSNLNLKKWLLRRFSWGLILGIVIGAVMVQNVISRPTTQQFTGWRLVWAVLWRGVVYGGVDGILLFAFPWIVTWRTFSAEKRGVIQRFGAALISWVFVIVMTTGYHLGYADFRSPKIIQPNIGSTIMALPTLLTANPIGSPVSHMIMHISAVVHSPHTELFLPPHRNPDN
jgi:hypothetical protein